MAEDTLTVLADKGAQIKSVTITAKDKIRFPEEQEAIQTIALIL